MSDTTGWKRLGQGSYRKRISNASYIASPGAGQWFLWVLYTDEIDLVSIYNRLADAKRAAHRHAEGEA